MQFTKTIFAIALAATTASAAPVTGDQTLQARDPDWITQHMARTCDDADTSCTWDFAIWTQLADPVPCSMVVTASNGQPASRSPGAVRCAPFDVSSGWSGQFEVGFTTFAVVDSAKRLRAFPAWSDNDIGTHGEVEPDLSRPVESF